MHESNECTRNTDRHCGRLIAQLTPASRIKAANFAGLCRWLLKVCAGTFIASGTWLSWNCSAERTSAMFGVDSPNAFSTGLPQALSHGVSRLKCGSPAVQALEGEKRHCGSPAAAAVGEDSLSRFDAQMVQHAKPQNSRVAL